MAETISNLGSGLPVEPGNIDRELKKLWEASGGVSTRASMMNFAVYCEGADRLAPNTQIIAEITQNHACRAILIVVEPNPPEPKVQAWISAHCHISRAGATQVCCEQITFLLEGPSQKLIPNIVFSHLDSDLPLYLWWCAEFPEPIDEQLWTWVDQLIYDSQKWDEPLMEFRRLRASFAKLKPRTTLCDLNWVRSLYIRQAVAQIFDHPGTLAHLRRIERASITYAPGYRSTAVLLTGWFMSQLRWRIEEHDGDHVKFRDPELARSIAFEFREQPGASIGECRLEGGGAWFRVANETTSQFLHVDIHLPDGPDYHHLLPSGHDETAELLDLELSLGGKHQIYQRALTAVEPLL